MTTERELISKIVAVIADAHDECLDGMHMSAREKLMDLIREGNAYLQQTALAAPVAPALAPVTELKDCTACNGDGTVRYMTTDRGPDDYEYDAECVACSGTGSADIADAIKALPYSLHRVRAGVEVISKSAVLDIIAERLANGIKP